MGVSIGPKIVTDGLVLYLDSYSINGFTKIGTSGTNNNYRALLNLANHSDTYSLDTTSKLSANYYTLYGLTYPESSQIPASRQGVSPGFENTTESLIYGGSRALNYFVFDEDSESWVSDLYFNGLRINGHCYDNYDINSYISESNLMISDCNNIKSVYPNATHIVIGSHAADRYTAEMRTFLLDLGADSIVDSWTSTTRQEFILIGKPGLGPDSGYGWAHENVSSAVANLVVSLPYTRGGGIVFDGLSDYITFPNILSTENIGEGTQKTIELWLYVTTSGTRMAFSTGQVGNDRIYWWSENNLNTWRIGNYTSTIGHSTIPNNTWFNTTLVIDGVSITSYLNGVADYTGVYVGFTTKYQATIGRHGDSASYYFDGEISIVRIYNKSLSQAEILQNYNSQKSKFGK